MRIAIAGATGQIGSPLADRLERDGHEVVRISRSNGIDLITGDGLDDALAGVQAVVDATNSTATDPDETVAFFRTGTANLLDAEQRAGVAHHVLLSIAGMDRVTGNAHYAGKQAQERLIVDGPVPWTIAPFSQFHDFAAMIAGWAEHDGIAPVPPLSVQPIDRGDVADVLAELAVGPPRGRYVDVVGPRPEKLVDMARRTFAARGRDITVVPDRTAGPFGADADDDLLLAAADARIAPTGFDDWLATQTPRD